MLSEQVEENHHTTLLSIFFRVEPVLTTPMCRISSRNGYYVGKLVTVAASVTTQVVMMYHRSRTHLSLAKDCPKARPVMRLGKVIALPQVGGRHHRYQRLAA
jgi:hypothetical protein